MPMGTSVPMGITRGSVGPPSGRSDIKAQDVGRGRVATNSAKRLM